MYYNMKLYKSKVNIDIITLMTTSCFKKKIFSGI
jgi:hypothetical protein